MFTGNGLWVIKAYTSHDHQEKIELLFLAVTENIVFSEIHKDDIPVDGSADLCVELYFASEPRLSQILQHHMAPYLHDVHLYFMPNKDWVAETQKAFPAFDVGLFHIHGSHLDNDIDTKKIPLIIDASTAFGTGEHYSTKGCLMAITHLSNTVFPSRILDMGCGSAILSIAAAKVWKESTILAVDCHPPSIEKAQEHTKMNEVDHAISTQFGQGYTHITDKYDLIMANILANPLCEMSAQLAAHLRPNGYAILSGFLDNQAAQVENAHKVHGLIIEDYIEQNNWVTLVMRTMD